MENGWKLSPLYDVNPIPYGDNLSLNVSLDDNTISLELAKSVAKYFGIGKIEADEIGGQIMEIVCEKWKLSAEKCGLTRNECRYMESAFDMEFK